MSVFFSILCFLVVADLFLWRRSLRLMGPGASWLARWALHLFFFLQMGSLTLIVWNVLVFPLEFVRALPLPVLCIIYLWHLLVLPLAVSGHLVWLFLKIPGRLLHRRSAPPSWTPVTGDLSEIITRTQTASVSRRRFLATLIALVPLLLTFPLSIYAEMQLTQFRIRHLEVTIPNLPPALDGMTIVHLADFHVGQFTRGKQLQRIVEAANECKADLMVFTGDLINNNFGDLPAAATAMNALRPVPILCEGNHDVGFKPNEFRKRAKDAGLRLLVDERLQVNIRGVPVQLLGLSWRGPHNWRNHGNEKPLESSMQRLLKQRTPGVFTILLAHHPHAWDYSADIPLTLAGHTHGGQLMLSKKYGFGSWMFRYWTGLYTRPGQALVVSNGVGNWFPLRINAPTEILHLTLRKG